MKILFVFTFILASSFSLCIEATERDECILQLYALGDGSGKDFIPQNCFGIFKSSTTTKNLHITSDKRYEVVAYKNAFFIKDHLRRIKQVTAGKQTRLNNIHAIDLDVSRNEIAILQQNSDISIFSSFILGNVAPLRVIRSPSLIGCTDLKLIENKIFVLNQIENSILVFDRQANFYAFEGNKKLEILKSYNNIHPNAVEIEYHEKQLIIKDSTGNILQKLAP